MSDADQQEFVAISAHAQEKTITLDQLRRLKQIVGADCFDLVHLFLPVIEDIEDQIAREVLERREIGESR
jgi:hypothetical protein